MTSDEDTDLTKNMQSWILKFDLLQRYSDPEIDKLLSKCCFADPQFKKRLSEDVKHTTTADLKSKIMKLKEGRSS